MDTRWKNTVRKIYIFIEKNWMHIVGFVLPVLGIFLFGVMIAYRSSYSTETVFKFGLAGNLCVGLRISALLKHYLGDKYRDWEGRTEYEEWKRAESESFRRLYRVGAVGGAAAVWYLYDLVFGDGVYGGLSNEWFYNYATGYVMVITVLIQFLLAQKAVGNFWIERLDAIMEREDEVSRIRLEEALEIERKSLEKVSRSDQLRVDLITNVSHDLKTPLTSMVGYIELIKKEELSDVVRDYIDVISARTEKLKEMINSLFSLAKASSGNVELKRENFQVNRLIEQIFADMDDQVKASSLKFVMQLTEEDTQVYSDNSYFYRICQNLIENTLKYSAEGTRVFVKTYLKDTLTGAKLPKPQADQMEIVPDAGEQGQPGERTEALAGAMQKERSGIGKRMICVEITNTSGYLMDFTKDDIVERFARGDQARTSEGNGLGLAIVSTYAKALGGEFDIRIDCDQFKACLEICQERQEMIVPAR